MSLSFKRNNIKKVQGCILQQMNPPIKNMFHYKFFTGLILGIALGSVSTERYIKYYYLCVPRNIYIELPLLKKDP
jgi:hypothetical protein